MSYNASRMKTVLTQQEIYALVGEDLERVEDELRVYTRSPIGPISEIGRYLIDAGGKRVRPALMLLTSRMLGDVSGATIRLAAVMELIHNATLVHDDVIDRAATRRGHPSANTHWGNPMTVLAGDWLYMQSFAVALGERNFAVLDTLIDLTQRMVEGELLQLTYLGKADVGEDELLDIAYRKTAHLFSGCTRIAAVLAGLSESETERITTIGMNFGMAFQLIDDMLDLTSTEEAMGKPVASDLKEGKVTLPVFYALANGGADARTKVLRVLEERGFSSVSPDEILSLVNAADGVRRTRRLAADHAHRAVDALEAFPPSVYRDAMLSIPEFILNRQV